MESTRTPIYAAKTNSLHVSNEMIGKYIKAEVTPSNAEAVGALISGDNGRNMVICIADVDKIDGLTMNDVMIILKSDIGLTSIR